jgi:hypothetical protein
LKKGEMLAEKTPSQLAADMVDVAVLEIAAHVEVLIGGIRDLQSNALRLRGVVVANSASGDPADLVRARLLRMLEECSSLRAALNSATVNARSL